MANKKVNVEKAAIVVEDHVDIKNASLVLENQKSDTITKKITFNKETLRNLVTMATREYFECGLRQHEALEKMLDKVINSYYDQSWCK